MAVGDLVASTLSKWGGACADCRRHIKRGGPVYKLATTGKTTRHGQGPGKWVCAVCATPALEERDIAKRNKENREAQASFDISTDDGEGDQRRARGHWTD